MRTFLFWLIRRSAAASEQVNLVFKAAEEIKLDDVSQIGLIFSDWISDDKIDSEISLRSSC